MSPYSVLPGMNGSLSKAKMNSSVLLPLADVPWDFSKSLLPAVSYTHTSAGRQNSSPPTQTHSLLPPHSLPAVPSLILIPTSHPHLFFLPSPSCDPEDKPQQPSPATRRHQLTTAISSSDRNSASRALCELAPCSPSQAPHPSTAAGCSGMFSRASYSHSKALVPS